MLVQNRSKSISSNGPIAHFEYHGCTHRAFFVCPLICLGVCCWSLKIFFLNFSSLAFSNISRTYFVLDPTYMVFLMLYPFLTWPHHRGLMLTLAHLVRAWEWASSIGCRSSPHVYERQCIATADIYKILIITINTYENEVSIFNNESTRAQGATNPNSHVSLNTNLLI
jgi:hypothetical protein